MIELKIEKAGLLIVDMQDKLFPLVDNSREILEKSLKLIKGCKLLQIPIVISEQYPKGLGSTIEAIQKIVGHETKALSKTTFSCLKDPHFEKEIHSMACSQWILMGIEAHVCVLQTAISLIQAGKQVVIAKDAIASRSFYDCSSAIEELRGMGARVSTMETILFDLVGDSTHAAFKSLSALIKS